MYPLIIVLSNRKTYDRLSFCYFFTIETSKMNAKNSNRGKNLNKIWAQKNRTHTEKYRFSHGIFWKKNNIYFPFLYLTYKNRTLCYLYRHSASISTWKEKQRKNTATFSIHTIIYDFSIFVMFSLTGVHQNCVFFSLLMHARLCSCMFVCVCVCDAVSSLDLNWKTPYAGIPSSQRTVAFEKACILFNLAGVYTQIATKQDRSTEKGLDIAVDNFLRAAGIFKHIHETFTNAPSIDLKPEFLEILVALMLAQARECLYEKLLLQIESFSISNKNHVSESSW